MRLGAWADVVESRAQYEALQVRRFARWLHHPAISPMQWYKPVLQAALVDWPAKTRLYVATSYDGPHALCPDPRLPAVSRSGDSSGRARHAPQEYPGRF